MPTIDTIGTRDAVKFFPADTSSTHHVECLGCGAKFPIENIPILEGPCPNCGLVATHE